MWDHHVWIISVPELNKKHNINSSRNKTHNIKTTNIMKVVLILGVIKVSSTYMVISQVLGLYVYVNTGMI